MTMQFKDKKVVLSGVVGVEDAEPLLQWLQNHPYARVVFSDCTHVHPANLQVLRAAGVSVSAWPEDQELAKWLRSLFSATDKQTD
jgi:hypothetical protein